MKIAIIIACEFVYLYQQRHPELGIWRKGLDEALVGAKHEPPILALFVGQAP